MTVSTTTSRADYTGNGVTTAFAVPFYFLDNTHLLVLRTVTATGVSTTLALGTDYSVTGAGVAAGGTITCTVAPTAAEKLSILRDVPLTQLVHYVPNDPFPAATHEQALDQLTMEVQQVNEGLDRALTLAPATTGVSTSLPNPMATKVIGWDATATSLINYSASDIATSIIGSNQYVDTFSGNGSTTSFTLSSAPQTKNNTEVFISGVYQQKSQYNISGTTITFTVAPPSGSSNIEVMQQAAVTYPVSSISPNTVGTSQLIDANVTTAKIADANVTAAKLASGAAVSNIGYTPANDSATVHTTGNETIAGNKTFSGTTQLGTITDGTNSTSSTNAIRGGAKAWVNFDGTTGTIRSSHNVTSVTRNGTGDYTINFTSAMPDANYATLLTGSHAAGVTETGAVYPGGQAAGSVRINWYNSYYQGLAPLDSSNLSVVIFR